MQNALKSAIRQAAIILLLASAAGLALGVVRGTLQLEPPAREPQAGVSEERAGEASGLTPQEARQLLAAGAIPLDARPAEDFALERLPGAINLPAGEFDDYFPQIQPLLPPEAPLITYCGSPECPLSYELAEILRQLGFPQVYVLRGGLAAWKAAGLEVEG